SAPTAKPAEPAAKPAAPAATPAAAAPAAPAAASPAAASAAQPAKKPTTLDEITTYMAADREQVLLEGALKEGTVNWYTSHTQYDELAKAFEAKYPGVKVKPFRENQTSQRLMEEFAAKRFTA